MQQSQLFSRRRWQFWEWNRGGGGGGLGAPLQLCGSVLTDSIRQFSPSPSLSLRLSFSLRFTFLFVFNSDMPALFHLMSSSHAVEKLSSQKCFFILCREIGAHTMISHRWRSGSPSFSSSRRRAEITIAWEADESVSA